MIEIKLHQIEEVLRYFNIENEVDSLHVLTNVQEWRKDKVAIRIIISVLLDNKKRIIVRFLNERDFIIDISKLKISTEIIEKQSEFSELLRNHGMIVPKKYQKDGTYCMPYMLDGIPVDVTVEDYLGSPIDQFDPEMFYDFGEIAGRMHQISLNEKAYIGFSIVFNEVQENRTDYLKLFTGTEVERLQKETMDQIIKLHNDKKDQIIKIWPDLPRGAVQGDIYSCNNIAKTSKGIGFYDFNIAADEVLLGDMLHIWFRTVYDITNESVIEHWDLKDCWNKYLAGYERQRKFSEIENRYFSIVYSLLGSIYAGRYVAELLRRKRFDAANQQLQNVLQLLQSDCKDIKVEDKE